MDAGTKCGKGTTFLLVVSNSIYSRYNSTGDSLSYRLLGCWIHFCRIKSIPNGKLGNFQQPALKKKLMSSLFYLPVFSSQSGTDYVPEDKQIKASST